MTVKQELHPSDNKPNTAPNPLSPHPNKPPPTKTISPSKRIPITASISISLLLLLKNPFLPP